MKKAMILVLVSLVSSMSLADCRDAYKAALQEAAAKSAASRAGAIGSGGTAGVAVVGLLATASLAATPVVLVSSGVVVGLIQYIKVKRHVGQIRNILYLIHESYTGSGKQAQKFAQKLSKNKVSVTPDQVGQWIQSANESNILCPINDITGEQAILSQKQIFKLMKQETLSFNNQEIN